MSKTGGDVIVETLIAWGVDTVFGLPGDGIDGIMEALRTHQKEIRFVQVRHEESAAFMACGYAKFTGRLGVCLATSGPGGIHLANGLYDAMADSQPLLAITGMQFHDVLGTYQQQDIALDKFFDNVALYSERAMSAAHIREITNLACRTAITNKGVAHITIPIDFQNQEVADVERSKRNVPNHTSSIYAASAGNTPTADIHAAADLLNEGKNVALLVGQGALGARAEIEQLAEKLQAPVIKALLGKAVLPDDSPYTTGGIGLLGTKPSSDAMHDCDTLFIIGSSFPYIEFYPKPGRAKGVQLDANPARIGLRFPIDVGLVGDSKTVLRALIPLLKKNTDNSFLKRAQDGMKDWRELIETRGTDMATPLKPEVVTFTLNKLLTDNAIVASDSGTNTTWTARQIQIRGDQLFSVSGNLATMACGLPYALAAQYAYPKRQVVAVVGDGGFSMLMADFVTAVKYKLPVKIVIIKNNQLSQIKWEQMVFLGNPQFGVDLQPIDFAKFAEACGGRGFTLSDPKRAEDVLREALAADGPAIIEAVVDPNEPPLPASVTFEQAKNLAKSLARGQKDRLEIVKTIIGDKIREVI